MIRQSLLCSMLLLANCSSPPIVTPCAPGIAQAPAPRPPRTLDTIVVAYNRAKHAGEVSYFDLKQCSSKVDQLLHILNAR